MDRLISTLIGVVLAIGISAALFIGANLLFDLTRYRWRVFLAAAWGLCTGIVFAILSGNGIITHPSAYVFHPEFLINPITVGVFIPVAIAVASAGGFIVGSFPSRLQRIGAGAVTGGVLGFLVGFRSEGQYGVTPEGVTVIWPARPGWSIGTVLVTTLVGVGIAAAVWYVRGRRTDPLRSMLFLGAFGWILGAWLLPSLDTGTHAQAQIAGLVAGLGLGAAAAAGEADPDADRTTFSERARAWIFLAPAMVFIGATLVIPTIRTVFLSFRDERGREFVGLQNFADVWNERSINVSRWSELFTSRLFWIALVLVLIGAAVGFINGRQRGQGFQQSVGSRITFAGAAFFAIFGLASVLRGTIVNNLWWVFTVTTVATGLGLAVAVLADRARFESVAKSFIFMPMAISFVGAGLIWRFVYQARQPTPTLNHGGQTGVMNAAWVGLGELSRSTWPKYLAMALVALMAGALLFVAVRGFRGGSLATGWTAGALALPVLWLLYSIGVGFGGWDDAADQAKTILFVQDSPFNNVWLMVVLIWIQTGFAMVILSAAIKAVPSELLEASRVDGATEAQSFWSVTMPTIAPTIGVVVTTLIVVVLKVFDIVKVMTNGNFQTQVIANEMWQRAFTELNFGLGSALAVVLFVGVLPVLYLNIRRMQEQRV